ncbi:hypothetical protein ACFU9X_43640 [Streptomyces atratus]|uniref:hypothetical protein n=1 Tax=Streptomyces atratus TaxID=1893 RepID=UPI003674EB59
MSSEMAIDQVNPRELSADSFTTSDIARIELGSKIHATASDLGRYVRMLSEDLAVAGDYVREAASVRRSMESLVYQAVLTERARGTSWHTIGEALGISAADAESRWGDAEARWRRTTRAQSIYRKDPGRWAARVDRYITTDTPHQLNTDERRPLSASLDAASHLTGRDIAAADHAFVGTACTHCSRTEPCDTGNASPRQLQCRGEGVVTR